MSYIITSSSGHRKSHMHRVCYAPFAPHNQRVCLVADSGKPFLIQGKNRIAGNKMEYVSSGGGWLINSGRLYCPFPMVVQSTKLLSTTFVC